MSGGDRSGAWVIGADVSTDWLEALLLGILTNGETDDWLELAVVTDASDGKLTNLDDLRLRRAWMLEGIVMVLPEGDLVRVVEVISCMLEMCRCRVSRRVRRRCAAAVEQRFGVMRRCGFTEPFIHGGIN
jgi:hypothetical protein